jgi:hypothetical protein
MNKTELNAYMLGYMTKKANMPGMPMSTGYNAGMVAQAPTAEQPVVAPPGSDPMQAIPGDPQQPDEQAEREAAMAEKEQQLAELTAANKEKEIDKKIEAEVVKAQALDEPVVEKKAGILDKLKNMAGVKPPVQAVTAASPKIDNSLDQAAKQYPGIVDQIKQMQKPKKEESWMPNTAKWGARFRDLRRLLGG